MNNDDIEIGVPVKVWAINGYVPLDKRLGLFFYRDHGVQYARMSLNGYRGAYEVEVVKLSDGRVVEVGKPVHVVWDASGEADRREAALSKLTPEERVMLGLGV